MVPVVDVVDDVLWVVTTVVFCPVMAGTKALAIYLGLPMILGVG